jgi:hypothetical protein
MLRPPGWAVRPAPAPMIARACDAGRPRAPLVPGTVSAPAPLHFQYIAHRGA